MCWKWTVSEKERDNDEVKRETQILNRKRIGGEEVHSMGFSIQNEKDQGRSTRKMFANFQQQKESQEYSLGFGRDDILFL